MSNLTNNNNYSSTTVSYTTKTHYFNISFSKSLEFWGGVSSPQTPSPTHPCSQGWTGSVQPARDNLMTFFLLIRSPLANFLPSKHLMTFFFAHSLHRSATFYLQNIWQLFFGSNCFSSDRPQRPKTDRPTGHLPGVPAAKSTSALFTLEINPEHINFKNFNKCVRFVVI